ncbi:cilia- and flagella-associated protein 276 [Heptranchias perlo]|uniref:cilia- and flagella-associated protein 276 n=1 Tax=Heptranchias perlo TaxID=212740 RepID=UPI003559DEE0
MPDTRDPFPFPKYENDDDFRGRKRETQCHRYLQPTHLAQQEDPWNRLNAAETVASASKGIYLYNPKAPRDSLDIHLNAVYDHSKEFLKQKNEVLLQKSTCDPQRGCWSSTNDQVQEETFRKKLAKDAVQKDICGCVPIKEEIGAPNLRERSPPRHWMSPTKLSIHSMDGAIRSQHTAATNGGYSRKIDGGFFTI